MKLHVGSKNETKINGVREAAKLYPEIFKDAQIEGVAVNVETFGHPKNIKETVAGAVERAKAAYQNCDYSFGIEGGLIEVPHTKSGYMEIAACAIYDGKNTYIGLGPSFEWPPQVTQMIIDGKADASQAFKLLGYTPHEKLGSQPGGNSGVLTQGHMTREVQTKYAIVTAMVHLQNPEWYQPLPNSPI